MAWLLFAVLSAFLDGTRLALSKKLLKGSDAFILVTMPKVFMIPFFALALLLLPRPAIDTTFWIAVTVLVIVGTVANTLQLYALQISPLSLTAPFINFTPLFLLLIAPLILDEMPNALGIVGILLIVGGAYGLNVRTFREGWREPIKAIAKERGALLMLLVAALFAVTATMDKLAIQHANIPFYLCVSQIAMGLLSLPIMVWKSPNAFAKIQQDWKLLCIIGVLTTGAALAHFTAIRTALVAYAISVKRFATVFSVLYGAFLFKEKHIAERLGGTLLMILGTVLIALA